VGRTVFIVLTLCIPQILTACLTELEAPSTPAASRALRAIDIAVAETHACAVTPGGDLYCWGSNGLGGLGTGDLESSAVPVRVPTEPVLAVELETNRGCAITAARNVVCWGFNSNGQSRPSTAADPLPGDVFVGWCGQGEDPEADPHNIVLVPARIDGVEDAVSLSLTYTRTCALSSSGRVTCSFAPRACTEGRSR
jgi:alpha-tubulin suppressor-like RCC1 family protein